MIALDTSALVASLCGPCPALPRLMALTEAGENLVLPALVRYEWLRGPRQPAELELQEEYFPVAEAISFSGVEAEISARLFRQLPRARVRAMDIAIAACALSHEAALWTLNPRDFADIPGLRLA